MKDIEFPGEDWKCEGNQRPSMEQVKYNYACRGVDDRPPKMLLHKCYALVVEIDLQQSFLAQIKAAVRLAQEPVPTTVPIMACVPPAGLEIKAISWPAEYYPQLWDDAMRTVGHQYEPDTWVAIETIVGVPLILHARLSTPQLPNWTTLSPVMIVYGQAKLPTLDKPPI